MNPQDTLYPDDEMYGGNDSWMEAAHESFEEALSKEQWALCREIIGDVRDVDPKAAITLEGLLVEAQNESKV